MLFESTSEMQQKPKYDSEAVSRSWSIKKMFLKISQNSKENTCVGVVFNKVAGHNPFFYRTFLLAVSV